MVDRVSELLTPDGRLWDDATLQQILVPLDVAAAK